MRVFSMWILSGLLAFMNILISCSSQKGREENLEVATLENIPPEPSLIEVGKDPIVKILSPREKEFFANVESVELRLDVQNFPLKKDWQKLMVKINNQHEFTLDDLSQKIILYPHMFEVGLNTVQVFCLRSWGESVKTDLSYAQVNFFYKERKNITSDKNKASVSLISPRGEYNLDQKIILDFVVLNGTLSEKDLKLRYTLNRHFKRELSSEKAVSFVNLKEGKYHIEVNLVDGDGKVLPQRWKQEANFEVKSAKNSTTIR